MPDFRATYRTLFWQLQAVTPEASRYCMNHFPHANHWGSYLCLLPNEAGREFDALKDAGFDVDIH